MNLRKLSPELQEKAINELNEVPNRIEEDLNHLKEWLRKQPHINARQDDQWLISFLRPCKYSLERAKEKLDMYYSIKSLSPEFFANRDPFSQEIQELLSLGFLLPLPKLSDPAAPRVLLIRSGHFDWAKYDLNKQFKLIIMIHSILIMEDDNYIIAGCNALVDLDSPGNPSFLNISPTAIKKVMVYVQKAYPNRIASLAFIKATPLFETFFKLFRTLLSEKLKKRVHLYSNKKLEEIHELCPKSILPKEYGGDGGTIDEIIAYWKSKVESYQQWFVEEDQYKTNEQKRIGKPRTTDSIFGIDGSFRQLDID